jgi:hypothetical protein
VSAEEQASLDGYSAFSPPLERGAWWVMGRLEAEEVESLRLDNDGRARRGHVVPGIGPTVPEETTAHPRAALTTLGTCSAGASCPGIESTDTASSFETETALNVPGLAVLEATSEAGALARLPPPGRTQPTLPLDRFQPVNLHKSRQCGPEPRKSCSLRPPPVTHTTRAVPERPAATDGMNRPRGGCPWWPGSSARGGRGWWR